MTMCTCNHQLQPHGWIEGVCPETPFDMMQRANDRIQTNLEAIADAYVKAVIATERDPEDIYRRDLGGEG